MIECERCGCKLKYSRLLPEHMREHARDDKRRARREQLKPLIKRLRAQAMLFGDSDVGELAGEAADALEEDL